MLRKILIATDLSEASEAAVREGFELARALHAEVTLLYTYKFPGPPNPASLYPQASQAIYEQALTDLARVARAVHDVPVKLLVMSGEASTTIARAAHELGADLIVAGAHRLAGLEGMLIGSVTAKLAHKSPCPVLVVPTDSGRQTQALRP